MNNTIPIFYYDFNFYSHILWQVQTKVPFLLRGTLREYQLIGLDWLVTMHMKHLNGILADEMGLGKTIQTIALLAHLACDKGIWGPHLVVVPTSVMLNWEMELKKWCPGFKILTYYGNQKERKAKRQVLHFGFTVVTTHHQPKDEVGFTNCCFLYFFFVTRVGQSLMRFMFVSHHTN